MQEGEVPDFGCMYSAALNKELTSYRSSADTSAWG